jgi:hypothetical protein
VSEPGSQRGAGQSAVSGVHPAREWLTYAEPDHLAGLSRITLWNAVLPVNRSYLAGRSAGLEPASF